MDADALVRLGLNHGTDLLNVKRLYTKTGSCSAAALVRHYLVYSCVFISTSFRNCDGLTQAVGRAHKNCLAL
jgi:hypothetical protein